MAKKTKKGGYAVLIQFPPQISKTVANRSEAEKMKSKLSSKIPARTGRKIKVVKV